MLKKLIPQELSIGMIAVDAVVTPSGQVLAPAGTTLTRQLINKAKLYKVPFVFVDIETDTEDEANLPASHVIEPVVAPPIVEKPTAPIQRKPPTHVEETQSNSRRTMVTSEFEEFQVEYHLFLKYLKNVFSEITSSPNYIIDTNELVERLATLFRSRNTITELFDMINQMHSISDSIYAHCINVALISRMLGRWLRLEQQDLNILTSCGLLHDIGKLAIPDEILNKPGKLTDEEFKTIKSHPALGYQMLAKQNIDPRIKQAVLLHHERYDGSGYPSGIQGEQVPDFAMIVAIADVYDAMTATRSYREPLCAFQVIDNFERDGYQKYHTKYIHTFLHQIASTYQSNRIILNDGRVAKIVMLNQNRLSKPMIQLDSGECIDLSTHTDLFIQKVL